MPGTADPPESPGPDLTVASTDGVTVAYLTLGGTGRRVLLAHATGFSATVWRPVATALAGSFRAWALDFRGHGRSTPPADGTFDWHGTADDVLAVIDAIDAIDAESGPTTEPWLGVGHSMGGAALLLAEQRRPGTFGALWVYEPVVFPPAEVAPGTAEGGNHLAEGAARRRPGFPSAEEARRNFSSKPPMDVFSPEALAGYLERGLTPDPSADEPERVRLSCRPEHEAQVYRMGGRHSAWAHLHEVACPVTVVVGDTAIPGPAMVAAAVADRLPLGHLESHPELGHFGPQQAPDAMAASITAAFGLR